MHTLLIVDDEEIEREGMAQFIPLDTYEMKVVGTARNGAEGLEKIAKHKPDLAIVDIKMPVMNGIVNFQDCVNSLFLSFHREFTFRICCIPCTCYPLLHPLSSCSGVQKVCKNVQSQNQPLKTGIGFLCKAGKMAGFEPETAAAILPV